MQRHSLLFTSTGSRHRDRPVSCADRNWHSTYSCHAVQDFRLPCSALRSGIAKPDEQDCFGLMFFRHAEDLESDEEVN